MASALRIAAGITSIFTPLTLVVLSMIEPAVWPRGRLFFEYGYFVAGIIGLATMFAFIWYARRSGAVPVEKRGLWVAVLFLGNMFALPFFWFWYVRKPSVERANVAV